MKDKNEQNLYEWLSEDLKPVSDILCTAKKFFCFRRFRLEGLPYCRGEWGECSYQQKKVTVDKIGCIRVPVSMVKTIQDSTYGG